MGVQHRGHRLITSDKPWLHTNFHSVCGTRRAIRLERRKQIRALAILSDSELNLGLGIEHECEYSSAYPILDMVFELLGYD